MIPRFGLFERIDWTAEQIPDLTGRVAIVTGANNGLGYVTALELVRHGAKTYLACRNPTRAEEAIEKIKAAVPGSEPQFLKLDIASLNSAHAAAHEFLTLESRLDILVNNAGISMTPYELSEDGIELQLCNAIGHFAFTSPLLALLEKTSQEPGSHVRIVNLSSDSHYWLSREPDFASLKSLNEHSYCFVDRYALSKLMIVLFTNQLQKRFSHTKIICTSVHPGVADTNIAVGDLLKRYPILKIFLWWKSWVSLTPENGAITSLYAATDPEIEAKDLRSAYLCPVAKVASKSQLAQDPEGILGKKSWDLCEALVREKVKDH